MKKYNNILALTCAIATIFTIACSSDPSSPNPQSNSGTPELTVSGASAVETDSGGKIDFQINASISDFTKEITFQYEAQGITAEPGVDFTNTSGQATIPVGMSSITISVPILNDDIKEIDEEVRLVISNAQNATIKIPNSTGIIRDNDASGLVDEDGYLTPTSYYGYESFWMEEFESEELDSNTFTFEIGDGCPAICGWGNNELQEYTSKEENIKLENGKMVITAIQKDVFQFESARLITKDKLEFQFGRIDVRAKLPTGQGLWPAIWMLGANIDEAGWPACGEIDIMELIGSEPNKAHGTAHWGNPGEGSTFQTSTYTNQTDFSEEYHVFSIIWESNSIDWYVDENKFHSITINTVSPATYRFNQNFFFVLNVAVGGRFPGNPDETTVFPQKMEIDYMRVFKPVN